MPHYLLRTYFPKTRSQDMPDYLLRTYFPKTCPITYLGPTFPRHAPLSQDPRPRHAPRPT
eukprot:2035777-Pyramimonas_sp.AAC.2